MTPLTQVEHVVVLMLENRSFDSLLGALHPRSPEYDGLAGTESNPDNEGSSVVVWSSPGSDEATMRIPDPDPGELWTDINTQIFGTASPPPAATATMPGFVRSYLAQTAEPASSYVAKNIMHYFLPEQVPVLSALARQFAVSDRWFAPAPCQTWPNRFFAHTSTAHGYQNNDPPHFPYMMETIFNRCEAAGLDWKIYFHDIPQSLALARLWLLPSHFRLYDEFRKDAKSGELPAYSFIEPRYFAGLQLPNDQHPPHVVTLGEQLIADVYNCLRAGPAWPKTLLIITYDEHGGCYDHVAPPAAQPPSSEATVPFNFDRYGVRVPAVIVSPYVQPGTVLRAPGSVPYDHTSIIATLRARFPELGAPLTERDAVAPDVGNALALAEPSNLGPPALDALPYAASPTDVAAALRKPLNGMQRALVHLAANLPRPPAGRFEGAVRDHIDGLRQNGTIAPEPGADATVASGANFVKGRMADFFGGL